MCLALRASELWLHYAAMQNLILSFPWIAPGWIQSQHSGAIVQKPEEPNTYSSKKFGYSHLATMSSLAPLLRSAPLVHHPFPRVLRTFLMRLPNEEVHVDLWGSCKVRQETEVILPRDQWRFFIVRVLPGRVATA